MSQTIQNIANIATTLGLIVALIVFIIEFRGNRQESEYQSFLILLENYQKTVDERKDQWIKVKKAVQDNPKIAHEIDDKQNSISYLILRLEQAEPMYAIEHGILDSEIRSLNYLDKLCEIALENDRALQVLLLTDAHEISYFQNRLQDILRLYESQNNLRIFHKPSYNSLKKCDVSKVFGQDN
ncbi:MAG: hypothetical protein MUO63_16865 [Desulfobulbaceae bacterium]|nr:hypothetical protein [Desulfobulbaceae bacterium]